MKIREIADNNTSISSTRWAFASVIKFDIVVISLVLLAYIIGHFVGKPFDSGLVSGTGILLGILTGLVTTSKSLQGWEPEKDKEKIKNRLQEVGIEYEDISWYEDGLIIKNVREEEIKNGDKLIVAEVAQHIGDNVVRCIAMSATDGLQRGAQVVDTGAPIMVSVGEETLGRMVNVIGEPIDKKAPIESEEKWPIHSSAPPFADIVAAVAITALQTQIK